MDNREVYQTWVSLMLSMDRTFAKLPDNAEYPTKYGIGFCTPMTSDQLDEMKELIHAHAVRLARAQGLEVETQVSARAVTITLNTFQLTF